MSNLSAQALLTLAIVVIIAALLWFGFTR